MNITCTHHVSDDVRNELSEALREHNREFVDTSKWSEMAVVGRDDRGALVGGLLATCKGLWLFIDLLWVNEEARTSGLGVFQPKAFTGIT